MKNTSSFATLLILAITLFCSGQLSAQWSFNNTYIWTTQYKNVGIGTSNPSSARLQFDNALGNKICLWNNGPNNQFGIGLNSGVMQLYTAGQDKIAFGWGSATNFTETMSFFPGSGRLALGTTSATGSKLEIVGQDALMLRGYQPYLNMRDDNYSSAPGRIQYVNGSWNFHRLSTAGTVTYQLWVGSIGNVGIGTTTPGYKLEVAGTAGKPGGGSWTAASDRRLKDNIHPYTDGLQTLLKIKPVTFHYNEKSGYDTAPEYVGVIAQELQAVAPYMVGETPAKVEGEATEKYLDVDNSAMTYMLINAVKEQHELIAEKETRIAALEAQNNELQSRLARIEAALDLAADRQPSDTKAATVSTKISPNPTSGLVTVDLQNTVATGTIVVKMVDATGREVASRSVAAGASNVQFDLGQFPVGVYVAQILADGKMVSSSKVQLVK